MYLAGTCQPKQSAMFGPPNAIRARRLDLVAEAARLGLDALALTDHDGFYGVVRFAEAAKEVGMPTVFGAELTLAGHGTGFAAKAAPRTGTPDPPGSHLVVIARDPAGYARLARALTEGHLAGGVPGVAEVAAAADVGVGHDYAAIEQAEAVGVEA